MFTYICLGTNDLQAAARFYDAVLAPLDLHRCDMSQEDDWDDWVGWGTYAAHGQIELALWVCRPQNGMPATAGKGTMIALAAKSWQQVQEAHAAALRHGGSSEGQPGLRPEYNPDFYPAYVRDPDGNKLAIFCRGITELSQA